MASGRQRRLEPARMSADAVAPTFQVEASQWLHRRKLRAGDPDGRAKTIRDLEWRLSVVMDKFGSEPIDRVDFAPRRRVGSRALRGASCDRARGGGGGAADAQRARPAHRPPLRGAPASVSNGSIRKALDAAERVLRDAHKRGVLVGEVPVLRSAAPKADRPRRSFLEAEQVAAVIRAAELIEAEHRGLTWETVALIRSSSRSAVALARELGVSDTLIRKVRRGELWSAEPERRNRNDVPRRVIIETLILGGLRVSELCGLDGPHLDITRWSPARPQVGHEVRCRRAQRSDRAGPAEPTDRASRAIFAGRRTAGLPDAQRYTTEPGQHPLADPRARSATGRTSSSSPMAGSRSST